MKWNKKIFIAVGIGFMLVAVVFLDRLVNIDQKKDPLDQKVMEEKDIYREQDWSDIVISENEDQVVYEDRRRTRFSSVDIQERALYFGNVWNNLCQYIPDTVEKYVCPLPTPILYEDGYEEDENAYQEYLKLLRENLNTDTKVGNLFGSIEDHIDEGCFYRYTDALSNRGGYYVANTLLDMMGEKSLLALEEYREELYSVRSEGDVPDPTYLYTLPDSKSYCELFQIDAEGKIYSQKYPVVAKRGRQEGSVLKDGNYEWAVIEGDGAKDAVLLIADNSGKAIAPYLANQFHKVIVVCLDFGSLFGTGEYSVERFFEQYHITKIICAQDVSKMGKIESSYILNKFAE